MENFEHLLSPIRIGRLEIRNRLVLPPMNTGYATPQGLPTRRMLDYYSVRARGGVGLIIVEAAVIHPSARLHPHMLALYDDRALEGLQRLTTALKSYGARVGIQLFHPGRQSTSQETGYRPVAPSALACPVCRELPRELTIPEIEEIIGWYVAAAQRAKEAGFELVELHAAHGYLINQFLSPHTNQRKDQYGGSLENRCLFLIRIIRGIKERLGEDFPLSCRINGADYIAGGLTLAETQSIASRLESSGVEVLHVSAGVYGSYPSTIPPMAERPGCFIHLAEGIKGKVGIPVIAVGKIHDPRLAEETIRQKRADLIAMGRALIADPQLPNKIASGRTGEIRPCLCCNQGCLYREQDILLPIAKPASDHHILCMQNPAVGQESIKPIGTKPKEKISVIGGGPAGMAAARAAAQLGHEVHLYEEGQELGGQLRLAARPPGKDRFLELIDRLKQDLVDLGVRLHLGTRITGESLEGLRGTTIILASGARPLVPDIPGIRGDKVSSAWDILEGKAGPGRRVLIIGGGQVGCETASFLLGRAERITIVEMLGQFAPQMGAVARWYLLQRLHRAGVQMIKNHRVREIREGEVLIEDSVEGGFRRLSGYDTIIYASGSLPRDELRSELQRQGHRFLVIGDALKPRKALEAIYEGTKLVELL